MRRILNIAGRAGIIGLVLMGATGAGAEFRQKKEALDHDPFAALQPVEDVELETMRGGFIGANGLQITFGLNVRTLVNQVPVSDITLNDSDTNTLNALQGIHLVQNGVGNISAVSTALDQNIPGIVTVIQNTMHNALIQQFNTLNIVAANSEAFRQQTATPLLNFQAVYAVLR